MKFAPHSTKPFTPITVTLENEKEVAALYAILNHSTLEKVLGLDGGARRTLAKINREIGNRAESDAFFAPIGSHEAHNAINEALSPQP